MSGAVLVAAGTAWACVPGEDHGDGGGTMGVNQSAATPAAPVAPAPPGPEAVTPRSAEAASMPAMPSVPAPASSPVTGAGMWNPAPATSASTSSSGGGSSQLVGIGLFAVGGVLVLGGVAQMVRRRPRQSLTPAT